MITGPTKTLSPMICMVCLVMTLTAATATIATETGVKRNTHPNTHLARQSWKLMGIDGTEVSPNSLLGKPRLLILSRGFECVRCNEQIQILGKRLEEFHAKDVSIHVFVDDDVRQLRESVGDGGQGLNFVADPEQAAFKSFLCDGAEPLHGVFLIDDVGNIVWSQTSNHALLDLDQVLHESGALVE